MTGAGQTGMPELAAVRVKRIRQSALTSDCWPVQVWGLSYCSGFGEYAAMCEYLATDECGGQAIRKRALADEFPITGLSDAGSG